MINALQAFETLIGTVCMPLSANVQPHLTYLSLFCLKVMSECLYFSHTIGSLHYDGLMTLKLGCC